MSAMHGRPLDPDDGLFATRDEDDFEEYEELDEEYEDEDLEFDDEFEDDEDEWEDEFDDYEDEDVQDATSRRRRRVDWE